MASVPLLPVFCWRFLPEQNTDEDLKIGKLQKSMGFFCFGNPQRSQWLRGRCRGELFRAGRELPHGSAIRRARGTRWV